MGYSKADWHVIDTYPEHKEIWNNLRILLDLGEVAEWLKAPHSKCK
jgi:hypothetical protein